MKKQLKGKKSAPVKAQPKKAAGIAHAKATLESIEYANEKRERAAERKKQEPQPEPKAVEVHGNKVRQPKRKVNRNEVPRDAAHGYPIPNPIDKKHRDPALTKIEADRQALLAEMNDRAYYYAGTNMSDEQIDNQVRSDFAAFGAHDKHFKYTPPPTETREWEEDAVDDKGRKIGGKVKKTATYRIRLLDKNAKPAVDKDGKPIEYVAYKLVKRA